MAADFLRSKEAWAAGFTVGATTLAVTAMVDGGAGAIATFAVRYAHVLSAMIWVGLIWYVNGVQLPGLAESGDDERKVIVTRIVPRAARMFRIASHVTLVSGLLMLWLAGYLTAGLGWRTGMLWIGAGAGVAMWVLVNYAIAPNLKVILNAMAPADAKAVARSKVARYARANQFLAIFVVAIMVGAAHG